MLFSSFLTWENLGPGLVLSAAAFVIYLFSLAVYNRYFHPYKDIPGPFWASVTSLWYFRSVRYGIGENTHYPIHRKYGPIVRLAPNLVQIADPAAIETIYGPKNVFQKAEFYDAFHPSIARRRDGFTERDDKAHGSRRRIMAPLYSQGSILSHESQFDRVIQLFHNQMDQFAQSGATFDMSVWLRKYTFDIIGELFYGREGGFGFIRDDIDYQGWCHLLSVMPPPVSALKYMPNGLRTLYMMTQMLFKESRAGMKGFYTVIDQAHEATNTRLAEMKDGKIEKKNDLLSQMIDIVHDRGDKIDWKMEDVTLELWATIWQASDTTAIALTSVFYHLHTHPDTLRKLLEEIETAFATGALTYPVRYNDAIKLPYLHAVVRESMRIHASLGTGLPRIVPKGGAEICGQHFPGGYGVIMNAMSVQFDKGVFGEDSEDFVPERWLREGDRAAAAMERSMLQFGYGPRMCIGRHVTNTEMYKLLPTILRDFSFELMVDEWTVFGGWFHHPKNVMVKATRR